MPATAASGGAEMPRSTLGDRRLVARAGLALLIANVRYWSTVAPVVRNELRRWELRARAIEDSELRALALEKLRDESFHAEAAAMLATLAPRAHRRDAVEAIVALELLFDYLDGLTERPSADPLRDGGRLFEAYTDAIAPGAESVAHNLGSELDDRAHREAPPAKRGGDRHREDSRGEDSRWEDGGYLQALSDAVWVALARLPAAGAIAQVARASAARGAQAQVRMHAAPRLGAGQVEQWARSEAEGTGLQWRELLAGAASSVLAVHALIAAAADPRTTPAQAGEIASAYLSTCVLLTLLDGLVDHEQDTRADGTGRLGYISFYKDRDELSQTLDGATRRAAMQARALPNGAHHAMTLVGVVAYYTSAPGARSKFAAPTAKRLQRQLAPLISPTLWIMRTWRLAKRMRNRNRRSPSIGLASSLGQSRGSGGCNEI